MKMTKPLTVLSLLAAFVVVSVASSPVTYPGSAESEEINVEVGADTPRSYLVAYSSERQGNILAIDFIARYASFEAPPVLVEENDENPDADAAPSEEIPPAPLEPSENAVNIMVATDESAEELLGAVEDNAISLNALPLSLSLCDSDLCAGHALITLAHSRGIDAELVIKAQGSWNFLNDTFAEPDIVLVECESDCIAERDAYMSDTLEPCAFEELGCSAPIDAEVEAEIDAEPVDDAPADEGA